MESLYLESRRDAVRAGTCIRAMLRDDDSDRVEADAGGILAGEFVCRVIALVEGLSKRS